MSKRLLAVLTLFFSFILFSDPAGASVSETSWDVAGTVKVRVTVQGLGSKSETIDFSDEITFHSNGNFEMTGLEGAWKQITNRFTVTLDPVEVEAYIEEFLGDNGFDVTVEITKLSVTGTERKNGTIDGKIILNLNFHLNHFGLHGKLTAIGTLKGTIAAGDIAPSDKGGASPIRGKPLQEIFREKLYEAIQAAGATAR